MSRRERGPDENAPPQAIGSRSGKHSLFIALDQITSSATNFGVAALSAGLLSASDFGAISVSFAIYVIALGACRTWSSEALVLLASGEAANRQPHLASGALSTAGLIACAFSLVLGVTSILLGGPIGLAIAVLAICLPGLMVQDAARYSLIVQGRARDAWLIDLLWMVFSFAAITVLRRTDTQSITLAVLAWGLPALASAIWGVRQTQATLRAGHATAWVKKLRRLCSQMSIEYLLTTISGFAMLLILTSFSAELNETGALRGAQTLLGPIAICFSATALYTRPLMVRHVRRGKDIRLVAARQSTFNVAVTLIWAATLFLIPKSVGTKVFGHTWAGARELVTIVAISLAGTAIASGANGGMRAKQRIGSGIATRAISATVIVSCTVSGLLLGDADGPVTGFAFGTLLASTVSWTFFLVMKSPANLVLPRRPPSSNPAVGSEL